MGNRRGLFLLVAGIGLSASQGMAEGVDFTVTNPATVAVRSVARVSLPLPEGLFPGALPHTAIVGGKPLTVQANVITRHPDGSIRRVMLSLPVTLAAGETVACHYESGQRGSLESTIPQVIAAGPWQVVPAMDRIVLRSADGRDLAVAEPFGPTAGTETNRTVIENGPHHVWLRYDRSGDLWNSQVDVQVSSNGEIRLTLRIQAKPAGDHWTPDFGWKLNAPGARTTHVPAAPVHFLGRNPDGRFADEANADLIAEFALADGATLSVANPLALRQNRGTFEVHAAGLLSNRNEPVGDLETEGLMIQEGSWRFSELLLFPGTRSALAATLDAPLYGHAAWEAYDAVYHTGPPLQAQHPVLQACIEKMVFALQDMQMKGDDLGSMPWSWSPGQTRRDYTSAVRLNHCLYVWEDWFRGGDPRLRAVAYDWCRNYFDLGMYWGPNPAFLGACRRGNSWRNKPGHGPGTFNPRFSDSPIFVHKGWSNFWLMYEETGDPRYRYAALAAADWSIANQHAGLSYTRTIGVVTDAVKMAEYTGDPKHLANAVHLWDTFQPTQGEDLLFTESGKPAVGNDLYIGDDAQGYKTPFVKPYIVQYATNALPYLLRHTPQDERLRRTILALNDWMARSQQPGGGWGYPHAASAGPRWNLEYTHGILLAYEVEPRPEYLDAAARILRPTVQLCELHGWPASGLNPWEFAAKINAEQRKELYHLASDRDPSRDYEEGLLTFGRGPDGTVYFQVVLRDYLRWRDEASLFQTDEILDKIRRRPPTGRLPPP
jgi:hypothetical protein